MLDIAPFTDEQWYRMCDSGLHLPVPLGKADLTKPFVYDRKWGVFYVPGGLHRAAMSCLLAFQMDKTDVVSALRLVGCTDQTEGADFYLENTPGTAFRSSVGRGIYAIRPGSLSALELRLLGPVEYLFSEQATPPAPRGRS